MFYAQHTSYTKLPTTYSSGALLCHPKKKQGPEGEVRSGNCNSTLPFLYSPRGQSPKGGMERIKMRGAVTEMSLYQNCNSVRNTNFQISDEQWFLEGKNQRLTCAVVGLALRGIQAVLNKYFLLPMNYPPWPSFLQPV